MIKTANYLQVNLINFYHRIEVFVEIYLVNLDPSLFQNVILGILALLVPVGVAILNFFFEERSKGELKANLELFILLKQVLKAKEIILFSILTLSLLSIYEFGLVYKILAIICFIAYVCWMIVSPLNNIWKWLLENNKDFAIPFLKNIDLRKETKLALTSWSALWLGVDGAREREITGIFISQIDDLVKSKDFEIAKSLSQSYISNIEKRDHFMIGYEVLPKILEWNEFFWEQEQYWTSIYKQKDFISRLFSRKYLNFFKKPTLLLLSKVYKKQEHFWNWDFFQKEFLQAIIKILLNGSHDSYELFTNLKKYIDTCLIKLEKVEGKEEKREYRNYIHGLLGSFCEIFFENMNSIPRKYDIWEHYFPKEWKITSSNSGNAIPRIFVDEFQRWIHGGIFDRRAYGFDDNLSEIAGGLFPSVHSGLFSAFLVLLFSPDIKYAIEQESNIYIINGGLFLSGEKSESEIGKMMEEQEKSRTEETIKIIFTYFWFWHSIKLYKDDMSEEENSSFEKYPEEKRKEVLKRVRKTKLQKMVDELEADELKQKCTISEGKEYKRLRFLKLIKLLIKEVDNN